MEHWHVFPADDLIDHDTESNDCICGPGAELVPTDDGDAWVLIHHSLDGRETKETR